MGIPGLDEFLSANNIDNRQTTLTRGGGGGAIGGQPQQVASGQPVTQPVDRTDGDVTQAQPTATTSTRLLGNSASFMNALDDQESGNNPNAVSPTGVVGYFQLTNSFIEQYGQELLRKGHSNGDIKSNFDLAKQVASNGVNALSGKYGNDPQKVLAAYNAGEGTVDAAIAQFSDEWGTVDNLAQVIPIDVIDRIRRYSKEDLRSYTDFELQQRKAREILQHRDGILNNWDGSGGGYTPTASDASSFLGGVGGVSSLSLPSERDIEQNKSGFANATKKSLIRGLAGVGDSFVGLGRMVTPEGTDFGSYLEDVHNEILETQDLYAIDDNLTAALDDEGVKAFFTSPGGLAHLAQMAGEQIPQFALMALTAGGASALTGIAKVGTVAGMVTAGGLEGTSAYNSAVDDGYTKSQALGVAAVAAGVTTIGSFVAADKLAGGAFLSGAFKKKLVMMGVTAFGEGLDEAIMPVADRLAREAFDPKETVELSSWDDVLKESAVGFTLGATTGAVMGGFGHGGVETETGTTGENAPLQIEFQEPTQRERLIAASRGDGVLQTMSANDQGHERYREYFGVELNKAVEFAKANDLNPESAQRLVGKKLREFQALGAYRDALGGETNSQAQQDIDRAMGRISEELGVMGVTPQYLMENGSSAIPVSDGSMEQIGKLYGVNAHITPEQSELILNNNRILTQMTVLDMKLSTAMENGDFDAQKQYTEEMRNLGSQIVNVFKNQRRIPVDLFGMDKKEIDDKNTQLTDELFRIQTMTSGGRLSPSLQARVDEIRATISAIESIQSRSTALTEGDVLNSLIPAQAVADNTTQQAINDGAANVETSPSQRAQASVRAGELRDEASSATTPAERMSQINSEVQALDVVAAQAPHTVQEGEYGVYEWNEDGTAHVESDDGTVVLENATVVENNSGGVRSIRTTMDLSGMKALVRDNGFQIVGDVSSKLKHIRGEITVDDGSGNLEQVRVVVKLTPESSVEQTSTGIEQDVEPSNQQTTLDLDVVDPADLEGVSNATQGTIPLVSQTTTGIENDVTATEVTPSETVVDPADVDGEVDGEQGDMITNVENRESDLQARREEHLARQSNRASRETVEIDANDKEVRSPKINDIIQRELNKSGGTITQEQLDSVVEQYQPSRDRAKNIEKTVKKLLVKNDNGTYSQKKATSYKVELMKEFPTEKGAVITQEQLDEFHSRISKDGIKPGKVLQKGKEVVRSRSEQERVSKEMMADVESGKMTEAEYFDKVITLDKPQQTYVYPNDYIGRHHTDVGATSRDAASSQKSLTAELDAPIDGKEGTIGTHLDNVEDTTFSETGNFVDKMINDLVTSDAKPTTASVGDVIAAIEASDKSSIVTAVFSDNFVNKLKEAHQRAVDSGSEFIESKIGNPVTSSNKVLGKVPRKAIESILNHFGDAVDIRFAKLDGKYGEVFLDPETGKLVVVLNEGMSDIETIATLLHELSHATIATLAETNPKLWNDIVDMYNAEKAKGSDLIDRIERDYSELSENRKVAEWMSHTVENSPLFQSDGQIDRSYIDNNPDSAAVKIYKKIKQMLYKLIAKITGLDLSTADKKRDLTNRLFSEMFESGISRPSKDFTTESKKNDSSTNNKNTDEKTDEKATGMRGSRDGVTSEDITNDAKKMDSMSIEPEMIDGVATGSDARTIKNTIKKTFRFLDGMNLNTRSLLHSMLKMDENSLMWKVFVTDMTKGREVEADWNNHARDLVIKISKAVSGDFSRYSRHKKGLITSLLKKAGKKGDDVIYVKTQVSSKKVKGKPRKTTEINLTPLDRVSLYLHGKNEQARRHLRNGGFQISESQEASYMTNADFDALTLTADERMIADNIEEFFNSTQSKELSKKYFELNGVELDLVEHYFPIRVTKGAIGDSNTWNMYDDVLSVEEYNNSLGGTEGMLKSRVDSDGTIYLDDALQALESSVLQTGRYLGRASEVFNARLYLRKATRQMKEKGLDAELSQLHDFLQRYSGETKKTQAEKTIGKFYGNVAVAALGLKLTTALKQVASIGAASGEYEYGSLAEVTAKLLKDVTLATAGKLKHITSEIEAHSPILKERFVGNIDSEINDQVRATTDRLTEYFMAPIQYMDTATITALWQSAKAEVEATGAYVKDSDEYWAAINDKTVEVVEKTQPNFNVKDRSWIANQGGVLKTFTMFYSARSQGWQTVRRALTDLFSDDKKVRAKARRSLTGTIVTQTALLIIASEAKNMLKDDEDKEDPFAGLLDYREYINTSLSGLAGVSEIMSVMKYGRDASTPLTEITSAIGNAITNGKRAFIGIGTDGKKLSNTDREKSKNNFIEGMMESVGFATGTPVNGVKDLIKMVKKMSDL